MIANPVREAAAISKPRKGPVRSLTPSEVDPMMALLRAYERAGDLDLLDLIDVMLGTGVRIGEALAIRDGVNPDGEPLLDLDHATVEVNATIIRVKGQGLIVQEWPKTAAGWRRLALPPYAVDIIKRRGHTPHRGAPQRVVFGSPLGHLRDPSNTANDLREVLDGIGCTVCEGRGWLPTEGTPAKRVRCDAGPFSWVTSHTFRKTVATRLDEAHLTARQIADQLGHASLAHLGRLHGPQVVTSEAARLLDR